MALAKDGDKVRVDIRPIIVYARPRSWFKTLLSLVRNPHFFDSDQNSGIIDEIKEINVANTFTMFWGTSGVVPVTFRKVFYAVHISKRGHSREIAQKETTKDMNILKYRVDISPELCCRIDISNLPHEQ